MSELFRVTKNTKCFKCSQRCYILGTDFYLILGVLGSKNRARAEHFECPVSDPSIT